MPLMDLFWSMLWFFLFFMWIWLLISLFATIGVRTERVKPGSLSAGLT